MANKPFVPPLPPQAQSPIPPPTTTQAPSPPSPPPPQAPPPVAQAPTPPELPLPTSPPPKSMLSMPFAKSGHKTLTAAGNLANLLPTGTVLAFQTLLPSFSNNGTCTLANKFLTLSLIVVCSIACFLSSFTDSFVGSDGKLYYGIAMFTPFSKYGFYIFNDNEEDELDLEKHPSDKNLVHGLQITLIDFVHAFASLIVFLVFAISSSEVQDCFFAKFGENEKQLVMNLPLGAGILSSFLFMLFPTNRRGIGYGDTSGRGDTSGHK